MARAGGWLRHPQGVWVRKALFQVHLWTGLGVGLYIVVISVTGSVLVYRSELRQRFNPEPRPVEISGPRLSEEALVEATRLAYPDYTIEVWTNPDDPAHAVTMSVRRDGGAREQLFFDPYTGEYLGHALPAGWRLTTWLLDLHDNLLAGETGRTVNGVGAVLLVLLSMTGAIIWWPGSQSWRRGLLIDWRPKPQSLESIRRSGSMYSRHRRIKEATASGRSICIVRWLITPTAIFLSFVLRFIL